MTVIHLQVKLSRILHYDVVDFCEIAVDHVNQVRTRILIWQIFFIIEKQQHPPMVTPPVNLASSSDLDVLAIVKGYKIFVISWLLDLSWPLHHVLRC